MSTPRSVAEAFADAAAALVGDPDIADILHHLVTACSQALDADAVAIMARDSGGELALLSATSHRVAQLEMLQAQRYVGPCIDVLDTDAAVSVSGADRLSTRWQDVGRAIADAGFTSVTAYPMRWRGVTLGGLNVFREALTASSSDALVGQAFADIATLAIVHSVPVAADKAAARLHRALDARALVEQAKGVIAFVDDVDMSTAYESLIQRARISQESLTRTAHRVIEDQWRGPGRS